VSHSASAAPLEFFTDRSLGRITVPTALRGAGLVVHTMAEVYGEQAGQATPDEDWLRLCGERGWIALHKDPSICRLIRGEPRRELRSLITHRVRSFCVMSQAITGDEIAARYIRHVDRMQRIARARSGPFVYGLYGDGMREISLRGLIRVRER
jgi:hypothetical protein